MSFNHLSIAREELLVDLSGWQPRRDRSPRVKSNDELIFCLLSSFDYPCMVNI